MSVLLLRISLLATAGIAACPFQYLQKSWGEEASMDRVFS